MLWWCVLLAYVTTVSTCDLKGPISVVSDGQSLKQYVQSASKTIARLNVINGTHWINLGGAVQDFGLVLGLPPASSSDTTLRHALDALNKVVALKFGVSVVTGSIFWSFQSSAASNVLIDYQTDNLYSLVMEEMEAFGSMTKVRLTGIVESDNQQPPLKHNTTLISFDKNGHAVKFILFNAYKNTRFPQLFSTRQLLKVKNVLELHQLVGEVKLLKWQVKSAHSLLNRFCCCIENGVLFG